MNNFIFSSLVIAEIFLSILAFFTIFKKMSLSSTESYCYSAILVMAIYSLFIQIFFLLHLQRFFYVFDICVFTFSSCQIWREQKCFPIAFQEFAQHYKQDRFILSLLISVWSYLFLQVLLLPPNNWDSMTYHLSRVLLFQQEGSLFIKNFIRNAQASYPWGYDILSFLFLRFYSDYGLPTFSFLSYITIVFGTYGLVVKIFNNTSLGLIVCFIIASLKGLILQATTTKNDIPCAAMSVICILAGYSYYQSLQPVHLFIIALAACFALSSKIYFIFFLAPFLFFYLIFFFRKHDIKEVSSSLISMRRIDKVLFIIPIGLLFFIMLNVGNNLINFGNIAGESEAWIFKVSNQYGVWGMSANMLRLLLQSLDPPFQYIRDLLTAIHDNLLGEHRLIATHYFRPFSLDWGNVPHEDYAWYGPMGFWLIILSIIYSLWKGKGYIRIISISLLAFFLIYSYKMYWGTGSARYFSLFFAGSGVCVAFLIQKYSRYRFFQYFKLLLLTISAVSLIYAALFNVKKPFTDIHALNIFYKKLIELDTHYISETLLHPRTVFFNWLNFVTDRNAYYDERFTSKIVLNTFCNALPSGKRVLLIGASDTWVFPFLIRRPDLIITIARPEHICLEGKVYNINEYEDYLLLKQKFDYLLRCDVDLNEVISNHLKEEKILFCIPHSAYYQKPICLYEFLQNR